MKDRLVLLIVGLLCSMVAWAFWSFFGAEAANILGLVLLVSLTIENRMLRAKLREQAKHLRE